MTWTLLVAPRGAVHGTGTHQTGSNSISNFQPPSGATYSAIHAPYDAVDGESGAPDGEDDPAGIHTPGNAGNAVDLAPDGSAGPRQGGGQGGSPAAGHGLPAPSDVQGKMGPERGAGEDSLRHRRLQQKERDGEGQREGGGEGDGVSEGAANGEGGLRSGAVAGSARHRGATAVRFEERLQEASHEEVCSKQHGLLGRWLRVEESSKNPEQHHHADVAEYKWSVLPCSAPEVPPSQWISRLRERGISEINVVGDSHQRFFALHLFFLLTGVAEYGFRKGHSERAFVARNERNETLTINFAWVDGIYRNGEHRCW